jgi:hypothetical protein
MTPSRHRRPARPCILLLLVLVALALALALCCADAARPHAADNSALTKKKHDDDDDDDDDGPSPSPSPDDDAIAQMKACHAERGKGRDACLAVPHCEFCRSASSLPLPDVCAHDLEAKLMPGVLWECEKDGGDDEPSTLSSSSSSSSSLQEQEQEQEPKNGDACEGLGEPACAASVGVCVWCVASAVPSACYTVDQAKALPPGVFECEAAPSLMAVAAS